MITDFSPLWISLKTAFCATVLTLISGIAAAWLVAAYSGKYKGLIDGVLTLPLVLPPTVVGFFLLITIGKSGPVGKLLAAFDISLIFSWPATVIAATVVSFPLMYKTVRGAFEQIDGSILDAARLLGVSEWRVFARCPCPWPGRA
jgi:molybdate transport system permease protein